MRCPKDKNTELLSCKLWDQLQAHECPSCAGQWIAGDDYQAWQTTQPGAQAEPFVFWTREDIQYTPSPKDGQAGLCPDCNHYLARGRVAMKPPFYVERCPNCGGVWCDRGEWDVLTRLGIHAAIPQLFTSDWQMRFRELEQLELERRATMDKLGQELAAKVFELADLLEQHPNGDFGVAYLMRRFDRQ